MYKSFKEMPIWQMAMAVGEDIYKITTGLPKCEDYGFTSQIRRSTLSISANISEAFGRNSISDKINFYYYCRGSLTETQSHLEYGRRVKYFTEDQTSQIEVKLSQILKELNTLILSLRLNHKTKPQPKP